MNFNIKKCGFQFWLSALACFTAYLQEFGLWHALLLWYFVSLWTTTIDMSVNILLYGYRATPRGLFLRFFQAWCSYSLYILMEIRLYNSSRQSSCNASLGCCSLLSHLQPDQLAAYLLHSHLVKNGLQIDLSSLQTILFWYLKIC